MAAAETSRRRRALIHPGLIASGATLLIAGFASDVLYWQTLLFQWNNVSQWLVAAGMVLALLAAIAFIVDLVRAEVRRIAWGRFVLLAVAALLGLLNTFVHSRDAYTAVVPEGIILSGVVALLLVVAGLSGGWSLLSRPVALSPRIQDARP
jgi:uncharacterized membrane protein